MEHWHCQVEATEPCGKPTLGVQARGSSNIISAPTPYWHKHKKSRTVFPSLHLLVVGNQDSNPRPQLTLASTGLNGTPKPPNLSDMNCWERALVRDPEPGPSFEWLRVSIIKEIFIVNKRFARVLLISNCDQDLLKQAFWFGVLKFGFRPNFGEPIKVAGRVQEQLRKRKNSSDMLEKQRKWGTRGPNKTLKNFTAHIS